MIDLPRLLRFSTVRLRLGLLLMAAVAPFIVVLLFAHFWVYQPLQEEVGFLSRDIETRFDGVARLQLVLTRSAMPVNDYLIHGHDSERREFQMLVGQVEAAFALVRVSVGGADAKELEHISRLYMRWHALVTQGEGILKFPANLRHSPAAAMAMESFDYQLDQLVDDVSDLLEHVRKGLAHSRDALESRHGRMTWFVLLSAFLATMVTLITSIYLSQYVLPPLAKNVRPGFYETDDEA